MKMAIEMQRYRSPSYRREQAIKRSTLATVVALCALLAVLTLSWLLAGCSVAVTTVDVVVLDHPQAVVSIGFDDYGH